MAATEEIRPLAGPAEVFNHSDTKPTNSLGTPLPCPAVTPDAEHAQKLPPPQPFYKPCTEKLALPGVPYDPYPKKPAVPESLYEPYKGI